MDSVKPMAARADSLLFSSIFPRRNALTGLRLFHSLRSASSRAIDARRSSSKLVSRRMASASSDTRDAPPPIHTITLPGGDSVQIVAAPGLSNSDLRNAIDSALFRQWLKNMQSEMGVLSRGQMCLRQVHIQGLDMFGTGVGFLKFKADVVEKETGRKIPGIVFARGPSVAVLILLESGGETYVVLTEQVRVPVGKFILELPAGMLDDERGDVVGTAVREVEEETGICLNIEDMVNLTAFLDPTTGCKVFPSPGGCDEELSLFLYRGHVEEQIINSLQGKEMGLRDHGELIKVHVVPYVKLWRVTADAKALAAIALYEMAKRDGLLPQRNVQNLST
ncbi:nudix hydrolase 14, chloroplastic isoform X1 [Phoenix dactylifera]|uniref:Nudix hydrolase 14, chloroplastic isoform X1 n=1 Tax=Phoenix dactylifera TaxID=42345 RepID=A0A8B7D493_PHODC|nr:nudix hydrolase 14, chloroplastic isoform X1 [Phoenix dactylifera]